MGGTVFQFWQSLAILAFLSIPRFARDFGSRLPLRSRLLSASILAIFGTFGISGNS
jgi:hypothetical protein